MSSIANLHIESRFARQIDIDEFVNIFAGMPDMRDNYKTGDLKNIYYF